jgi:hypothetical protein
MTANQEQTLALLDATADREFDPAFGALWATTLVWIEPFYDAEHLRSTVRWLVRLEPAAPEPLLIAALTHDMERHFPGGTQPDKAAGAWDDLEYNTRHQQRSAQIVCEWLRAQDVPQPFVEQVGAAILQHEFGGSPTGNLMQAADSLSFLDVNGPLVVRWVTGGETSLKHALRKLEWMYERIQIDRARKLAQPLYQRTVTLVAREVEQPTASP